MSKRYEIKTFPIINPNVAKKTFSFVSGNKEAISLKTDIRFSGTQNGGQGAMRLVFNKKFKYGDFELGDLISINSYDENNLTGQGVYSGYISNIKRLADPDGESIEITTYGLATLTNTVIAGSSIGIFNYTNTDPSVMITALLDQFNSKYPFPLITFDPIPFFGSLITFRADRGTILSVLQQIHDITGWVFYVDGAGNFTTQPKGTTPDHIFTLKYDLNSLEKNLDRSDIVNRILVKVTNNILQYIIDPAWRPQDPPVFPDPPDTIGVINQYPAYFSYDNFPSQAIEGVLEAFLDQSDIQISEGVESAALISFANDYLATHAEPKNFLRLEINEKSDYLSVKPGDLIRIKNIDFTIDDAVINTINYSSTGLSVDCEKTISFAQEVVNS